LRNKRL